MLETPFMDEVNRATYHEMARGGHKSDSHKRILARYRQALRRAQRFSLDDDAVRMICRMTHHEARMELWSILARLPFDTVWIEFDLHEKVKEFERMGTIAHKFDPEQVSRKSGILFQRDLDSETRWVASEFFEVFDYITVAPVSMVFDPEGSALKPVTGCLLYNELTVSKQLFHGEKYMPVTIVETAGDKKRLDIDARIDVEFAYLGLINTNKDGELAVPEELQYKIGAVAEPMWRDRFKGRGTDDRGGYMVSIMDDARERSGILKWYIVALAMINDVPLTYRLIAPRHGHMLTKQGPIKYMDSKLITLKLPKPMDYRYVGRALNKAAVHAQRKWHRVRGHWRVVEHGVKMPILCRHEPTMVENGLAICTRCERVIRWIKDHHRGSELLGVISHEYNVTT